MTRSEAYNVIRNNEPDIKTRLEAHHEILRFGAVRCGETARQMLMAEAISDICLVLAKAVQDES